MVKYYGFGIACLLVVSGISQAGMINGNDNKKHDDYGNKGHDVPTFKCDEKHFVEDICKDYKFDMKGHKDIKIDLKDICKDEKHFCDIGDKHGNKGYGPECKEVCKGDHYDCGGASSVPLPASSAMGGIGAAAVALMSWVRSRRASIA